MSAAIIRLPQADAQPETVVLHDKSQDSDLAPLVTGDAIAPPVPFASDQPLVAGPSTTGRIIVFLHVSGGAGATTLAVNMAASLNQGAAHKSCAILDFDLQFGSVASLLDVPRSSAMQALIDEPGRLERTGIDEMLTRHASELHVLPATRIPLPLDAMKPATAAAIIDAARARFRYTIIDMPAALGSWTDVVLNRASKIYLITPITVPAAHNLARFFFLLQQHDLHLPISIVVNRHGKQAKHSLITPAEFNSAIGRPIDHLVPEDYPLVEQSLNQGTPAVTLAPKSAFAQALGEIVASETGEAVVAKRGLFGFF